MPSMVIRSFAYDPERRELSVVFQSGRSYRYLDVPAEIHDAMRRAFSKGSYFNDHIRDRFAFVRNPEAEGPQRASSAPPRRP